MARKKEPDLEYKNRDRIVQVAKKLFLNKGIENTTMSDIAKAVGMSKSTLYVYYKSKEEVRNYLSLEAMDYFYTQLQKSVIDSMGSRDRFFTICDVLVTFKRRYPLNFGLLIEEICIEEEVLKKDEILRKIYEIGEAINQFLIETLGKYIIDSSQIDMFIQIMSVWAKIFGIVTVADNKEKYIRITAGITKEEFLRLNFQQIYQSIEWKED